MSPGPAGQSIPLSAARPVVATTAGEAGTGRVCFADDPIQWPESRRSTNPCEQPAVHTSDLISQFISAGQEMARASLAPAGAGGLAVWTPEAVWVTREGAILGQLVPEDIAAISRTTMPPTATPAMDAPIYRGLFVATVGRAALHAHPLYTLAVTAVGGAWTPPDHETRYAVGSVPVITSRRGIVDEVTRALEESVVVVVRGHGTYARGATLAECLRWTAMVEASAHLAWLTSK